jgi:hypothetical protein
LGLGYNGKPFKLKFIDLSNDTQVNSGGGTNTQTLQPPTGKIYQIAHIDGSWPAIGGATGNHQLIGNLTDGTINTKIMQLIGTDGALFSITESYGFAANTELPGNITEQYKLMHESIFLSNTYYLDLIYTNSSDTNQTGTRAIYIYYKEFDEVI